MGEDEVNDMEDCFEENFRHLIIFREEHGDCHVPARYKTPDGSSLGKWVFAQRKSIDGMSSERRKKLESLSGWSWDCGPGQWEENFRHLMIYREMHGDCHVPLRYKTPDGSSLGKWVSAQRKSIDGMSSERRKKLESLSGWVWRDK